MKPRILIAGISALVVVVGSVLLASAVGRVGGELAGSHSRERLQLVWPSIMDMPVNDRALLVGLAITCHLERRPAVVTDVVACLQDAVDDPHALFPNGVDRDNARARLDQLLHERKA